jgi:Putative transposase
MTERAAYLVDAVLPWVPVRQWVLTMPYRLRYQMAWRPACRRVGIGARSGGAGAPGPTYLAPAFAQERLRLRNDGRVALELKTAWHDGTRELIFEPPEFLERLAAMTPRPETNLLICHGVLAPRALWRERVVAYGRVAAEPAASTAPLPQVRTAQG